MHLVVTGHVDHGKSTILGRLLADTGSLPESKLAAIRAHCARTARPFEYAFLLDALRDERAQGITIDAARVFFKSARRDYILIDAPGHSEFLRNMITGAARAEAALLVIDAREGVRDNSRRHGYLLSMLGITQLAVLVNKMDLVGRSRAVFDRVTHEYQAFLAQLGVTPAWFIPVSGMTGENIVHRASDFDWYRGPTVLEALDAFTPEPPLIDAPFRLPVQDVYKFTEDQDERRIIAGTIASGRLAVGDRVLFLPSGKTSRVKSIEAFNQTPQTEAIAGDATGFTLEDHLYIGRGELAARADEPRPCVVSRLRASLFWLGHDPLVRGKEYLLKLGAARVPVRLETVHRVVDASSLASTDTRDRIERSEVADCTLAAKRPFACDTADLLGSTSRFVLVDRYRIVGGGIVREMLEPAASTVSKSTHSLIEATRRAERFGQRAGVLIVTGDRETAREARARALEDRLFEEGRLVYLLRPEDAALDRLPAIGAALADAGVIAIAPAAAPAPADLERLHDAIGADRVATIACDRDERGEACDASVSSANGDANGDADADGLTHLLEALQARGWIPAPADRSRGSSR